LDWKYFTEKTVLTLTQVL